MAELTIDTIAMAVAMHPVYRPVASLDQRDALAVLARRVAGIRGVPVDRMAVLDAEFGEVDLAGWALAELGPPTCPQPLYLIQPDADFDPFVAELPRLVQQLDWEITEDIGVTQLDELGATILFGLLDWSLPGGSGATAVVVDRPSIVEQDRLPRPLRVLALRVCDGGGPVRVVGYAEGRPTAPADHRFTGSGPCDAWAAFHRALHDGLIVNGDRVLLHTDGPTRQGWLLLEIVDVDRINLGRSIHYGS